MFDSPFRYSVSTNLTCLLPKPGGGERAHRPSGLCCTSCGAARARFLDSAVRGCSALQLAIHGGLLQEVGVILGEPTTLVQWDLQKFNDSICVRHLLRLGAECGFSMRVAVVDLQVHLGWRPCVGLALFAQPQTVQQVFPCVCEKYVVRIPGEGSQVGAVGHG